MSTGDDVEERATDSGGETTDPERSPGVRRRVLRLALPVLQWVVALGAFWYVARDVDWAAAAANLADVSPVVVFAILVVTAFEFASRFTMWYVLVNAVTDASLATTARVDLVIKFVNHLVPSKASGHSVAPLVLRHFTGVDWTDAVSLAGVNTGLYAALYGVTALSGLAYFGALTGRLASGWVVVILLSTGVYVAAGGLVLLAGRRMGVAGRFVARLERLLGSVPRVGDRLAGIAHALPSFTEDSAGAFRGLSSRPGVVVPYALGWAGNLLVAPGVRVLLLLGALGGDFSPAVLLGVALVMAYSVTVLPLTPGGVGVAEASATAVLVALGVAPDLAAVAVLVDRTLGVYLPAVLGWLPAARVDLGEIFGTRSGG
ncbi:MAG: lysylphosphatidylglycerol synthase transmembrane domain-containing protein [Haloarculaceae archaeon]